MMLSTFILVFAVSGLSLASADQCDDSDPNSCGGNGKCVEGNDLGEYVCECSNGWTGPKCATPPDQCDDSDPISCGFFGECVEGDDLGEYVCQCSNGFTGPKCTLPPGPCYSSPCENGGICSSSSADSFSCSCVTGYTGELCDIEADPCQSSPCKNDGVCSSSSPDSFSCSCATGYTGDRCETKDPCVPDPCGDHGRCVQEGNSGTNSCNCFGGWTGDRCTNPPDPCRSSPCNNGGTCSSSSPDSFSCSCPKGYSGERCETKDVSNCFKTNYKGGPVTDLWNSPNGVTWTYQIPNFGFDWPSTSILGIITLDGIVSIKTVSFRESDNLKYFRIVFKKKSGEVVTTNPIGPNDKNVALTGVDNVARVDFYFAAVDNSRNVSLVDVSLKYCFRGLLGILKCFLFDVVKFVAAIVPCGIVRAGGTPETFSVSIAPDSDSPFIDANMTCISSPEFLSTFKKVDFGPSSGFDYVAIKVWNGVNEVTVIDKDSVPTNIFKTQDIAFGSDVIGDRILTTIIPNEIPNQGISGAITFTKYLVYVTLKLRPGL